MGIVFTTDSTDAGHRVGVVAPRHRLGSVLEDVVVVVVGSTMRRLLVALGASAAATGIRFERQVFHADRIQGS